MIVCLLVSKTCRLVLVVVVVVVVVGVVVVVVVDVDVDVDVDVVDPGTTDGNIIMENIKIVLGMCLVHFF